MQNVCWYVNMIAHCITPSFCCNSSSPRHLKNLSHLIESHSLIISHKTKKKLCRNYGPISVLVRHEEGTQRQEAPFEKPRVLDFSSWASQHAGQISSQHATDPTVTKWMCNCATSRVKPARELQDFKVQMKCEVFLRHLHGFSWRKLEYTLNILLISVNILERTTSYHCTTCRTIFT